MIKPVRVTVYDCTKERRRLFPCIATYYFADGSKAHESLGGTVIEAPDGIPWTETQAYLFDKQ